MILRKEMRRWDHKALPTQVDDIHLASVPVDSKMLGAGASGLFPWISPDSGW